MGNFKKMPTDEACVVSELIKIGVSVRFDGFIMLSLKIIINNEEKEIHELVPLQILKSENRSSYLIKQKTGWREHAILYLNNEDLAQTQKALKILEERTHRVIKYNKAAIDHKILKKE